VKKAEAEDEAKAKAKAEAKDEGEEGLRLMFGVLGIRRF